MVGNAAVYVKMVQCDARRDGEGNGMTKEEKTVMAESRGEIK